MPIGLYNLRYRRTPPTPNAEVILINVATDGTFTRSSSGSFYSGSTSQLGLVGPNVRRFEDRGDGYGAQLLIEGSRSNFVKNNRDLNSAVWTGGGAGTGFFENDAVSVDGVTEADRLYVSATFGNYQSYTLTTGSTYAISVFVRSPAGSGTLNYQMGLQHGNVAGTGTYVTGTVGESYQRVEFVSTTNAVTNHLVLAEGRGVGPLTQSVVNAVYDLPQVELGTFPTSPISSSSGGSVRAADVLMIESGSVPDELRTVGFEFDFWPSFSMDELLSGAIAGESGYCYLITIRDHGNNNLLYFRALSTGAKRLYLHASGSSQILTFPAEVSFPRYEKLRFILNWQDKTLQMSGASIDNTMNLNLPGAWNSGTLYIGTRNDGFGPAFGRFSDIRRSGSS